MDTINKLWYEIDKPGKLSQANLRLKTYELGNSASKLFWALGPVSSRLEPFYLLWPTKQVMSGGDWWCVLRA